MPPNWDHMPQLAERVRRATLRSIHAAGSGHSGGCLSATDLLVSLYFGEMHHAPADPKGPERDRFVLCKGHACPALYAVLAEAGYFPKEELRYLRKVGALLEGHPHLRIPGVDMTTGSLGQGLSTAAGMALGARLGGWGYRAYALLGDGELDEGQVWEAAMAAAHYQLDNLLAIVDYNKLQSDDFNHRIMGLEPILEKWRAFGWKAIELDGHDFTAIRGALQHARETHGRPTLLLAHTTKGKGVSFMEDVPAWHGSRAPTDEELETALAELGANPGAKPGAKRGVAQ